MRTPLEGTRPTCILASRNLGFKTIEALFGQLPCERGETLLLARGTVGYSTTVS